MSGLILSYPLNIAVEINGSTRNPSHNGLWILDNATYDSVNDQFNRIDTSKVAFGVNLRATHNIPYESSTGGIMFWRATAAANPISNTYGAVGGWENMFLVTEFKDMVIGGFGFEIDGAGSPYGRIVSNIQSAKQYVGLLTNLFLDYSSVDNSGVPSWRVAINQTDDKFVIDRAAAGAGSTFTNLLTIDSSGILDLPGGGIKFPATQVASSNVNTLDDYEEGTFTPSVFGTSTAGAATYTVQSGKYTKIGNIVYFQMKLGWSAHTGTGNTYFSGLPFTSNSSADNQTALSLFTDGHALTGSSQFHAKVDANATTITLEQYSTTSGPSAVVPIDTVVGTFIISGFYFT